MKLSECRFCGLVHQPCDKDYCYCGETVPNAKGEGFNNDCTAFWGDGT